jgi:alkyldihydroxyacetonephosphate synthase
VVGGDHLLTDAAARLGRSGGLSYLDLLRHWTGDGPDVPDAVALPGSEQEVDRVLAACVEHDIAVVPFGGGTSVVGGVDALRGDKSAVLVLDLGRLDGLVRVDPVSRLATFRAGTVAPEAERLLARHGLTLGHIPQSYERATLGGFAAARSAGQASSGYGSFPRMVEALRISTPRGPWALGVAPESAAGPDLRELVLGSEGALGVITEVTVRVRETPSARRYEGYVLDGWDRGLDAVRALAQHGVLADVTRLSDPDETAVGFTMSGAWKSRMLGGYLGARGVREPCLLVLGWESTSERGLRARRAATRRVLRAWHALPLGRAVGESWRHGRFSGPRQRDALLDVGMGVETLETAAFWSRIPALRESVRDALAAELTTGGRSPVVMCHVSHAYETGASLYFTVLVPRDADPESQWRRAKQVASEAIADAGTISHHHGVGVDHAPYLAREIGTLGVDTLAAMKSAVDPTGIMNPGKLLP